jgi:hypothetical protein
LISYRKFSILCCFSPSPERLEKFKCVSGTQTLDLGMMR